MSDKPINPFVHLDDITVSNDVTEKAHTTCEPDNQQLQQQNFNPQMSSGGYNVSVAPQNILYSVMLPNIKLQENTRTNVTLQESSVYIDLDLKKVFFIKTKNRSESKFVPTHYGEVPTGSKNYKLETIEVIADGVFRVERIVSDEFGNTTIYIKVNTVDDELELSMEEVTGSNNSVIRKFGEKGLIIDKKYTKHICKYIVSAAGLLSVVEKHHGFYIGKSGTPAHDDESNIRKLACDCYDAPWFFGLGEGIHDDDQALRMVYFCLLGISSMLTLFRRMNIRGLPLIVIWADNVTDTYNELSNLFYNGKYRKESFTVHSEKEIPSLYCQEDCFIPVIVDKSTSPRSFSAEKQANSLIISNNNQDIISTSAPVIITSDPALFKNESVMIFRYNSFKPENIDEVYNSFKKGILYDNSLYFKLNDDEFWKNGEYPSLTKLYGERRGLLYLLLKYVYLWFAVDDVDEEKHCGFYDFLNSAFSSVDSSGENTERFCRTLLSCDDLERVDRFTATEYSDMCLYLDKNYISMSSATFSYLAKKSLCNADLLKDELKNNRLLVIDTGTYQKNVNIANRVRNVYCISQPALYGKYNVVMYSNEFINKAPDYRLGLGVNNDTEIYYSFDSIARADNQHCFVFGNSGCGKTTLLKSMICESIQNGFECLVIDAKGDYSGFSGEHFYHISFGDEHGYVPCSSIDADSIVKLLQCTGMKLSSENISKIKAKCGPIARKTSYPDLKAYLNDCYFVLSADPKTKEFAEMLRELGELPIFRGKLLDWQNILQSGRAVIFDLQYDDVVTDDEVLSNIADTILQSFFMYKRTKNLPVEERTPCMVFVDEVKNYKIGTKSAISNILSQGRSGNIAAVLATQYLSADNGTKVGAVIGQCNTVISFNTSEPTYAVKFLECSNEEKKEMADALKELTIGEAIVYGKEKTISTDTSYVHNYLKVRFDDFSTEKYQDLFC